MRTLAIIVWIGIVSVGVFSQRDRFQCYMCDQERADQEDAQDMGCTIPLDSMDRNNMKMPERPNSPTPSCFIDFTTHDDNFNKVRRRGTSYKSPGEANIPEDPSTYECKIEKPYEDRPPVEYCYCYTKLCNGAMPDCKVRAQEKAKC